MSAPMLPLMQALHVTKRYGKFSHRLRYGTGVAHNLHGPRGIRYKTIEGQHLQHGFQNLGRGGSGELHQACTT